MTQIINLFEYELDYAHFVEWAVEARCMFDVLPNGDYRIGDELYTIFRLSFPQKYKRNNEDLT
jgi:hypothetical protein